MAYPKKSSGVVSDLTRDAGWKMVLKMGYEEIRQVAVDNVWSALRFKHKPERKRPSKMGASYLGIDKENMKVTPPGDLETALISAGLSQKFRLMSFTRQKECVLAVLDAKRAETRANRISKIIKQVAGKEL